ncbi:hypothetical protein N0V93_009896 [Gnomoniopsis smithogilvyi]|uniref:Trichodiene oxygenase n=1 Tax=Gnomoniopsis smithogilvyi TaxID=1191159 RepID=A0A9W8YHW1_9PEZI|nr:hypothetical protein N0V93_009896 [Gnomoniopsis smithogilvyi]
MEYLRQLPWHQFAIAAIVYYLSLGFYRLFLHPLAKFPGPKIAAATRWYEAYYDVVLNGAYTFKIAELHKKHGPIVRISPHELHISDATYYERLYRQEGLWNKYAWANKAFGVPNSTITCVDHTIHKRRREPLERFMSRANVIKNIDIVQRLTERLSGRIEEYAGKTKPINLGNAISAFVRDVATEFLLDKTYDNLGSEDFNEGMTAVFQGGGHVWRWTKHMPWFGPLMKSMPTSVIEKIGDKGTKDFFGYLKDTLQITQDLHTKLANAGADAEVEPQRTIVHAITLSSLPSVEKTLPRLFDDVSTVTGAAFETTAATLRLILFYVYSNTDILTKLRNEFASAGKDSRSHADELDLQQLERMPYLTAVLTEGLRMSPGVATRLARIAPDRDLMYEDWCIPAGTPVGMTTLLMHYDEIVYPEPDKFDPGRWLDVEDRRRFEKVFGPFSRGTRICLGMHLAWVELYLVVAALVLKFDFQLDGAGLKDVKPASDQFIAGTEDQSGIKAFVTKRKLGI